MAHACSLASIKARLISMRRAAVTELNLSWYNLRMSKTVTTLDQHSSVPLPPEALDALGIEAGAELEVEIVGRALVVRPVEEARRSAEFINAFESVLSKRRTAYEELAKGPDQ